MKKKMTWKKLKDYECPECSSELERDGNLHVCSSEDCRFIISGEKYNSVMRRMSKPIYEEPDRSGWDW